MERLETRPLPLLTMHEVLMLLRSCNRGLISRPVLRRAALRQDDIFRASKLKHIGFLFNITHIFFDIGVCLMQGKYAVQ